MTARDDEMRDRRQLVGSTNTTTYFREAEIALALESGGGRFAANASVIGSRADAGSAYPRLPSNSPSAFDPVPNVEPPLGWSVEDQEACGTAAEIEASLVGDELARAQAPTSSVPHSPEDVVETGSGHPSIAIEAVKTSELAEVLGRLLKLASPASAIAASAVPSDVATTGEELETPELASAGAGTEGASFLSLPSSSSSPFSSSIKRRKGL
jgi:hypothetical protein